MALSTRQRWMLYGVAALLTGAAMLAVQPQQEVGEAAASLPAARPARAVPAGTAPAAPAAPLALPQRPYGGAGRSPFGDPALAAAATAAQAAAAAPPPTPVDSTAAAPAATAAALPFRFLGRWTEDGTSTVFLAQGQRLAGAGRHMQQAQFARADVLDQVVGCELAAGQASSAPAAGPAPAAADTEEQN